MTLTDTYSAELKKLKAKQSLKLDAAACTMARLQGYYRAARKLGIKVSIKNAPDGMRVWRVL